MKQYILVYAKTDWLIDLESTQDIMDTFGQLGTPFETMEEAMEEMAKNMKKDMETHQTNWIYNILEEEI